MLGSTYFWSNVRRSHFECWVCAFSFGCNLMMFDDLSVENGLSVRCVKDQVYDLEGNEVND